MRIRYAKKEVKKKTKKIKEIQCVSSHSHTLYPSGNQLLLMLTHLLFNVTGCRELFQRSFCREQRTHVIMRHYPRAGLCLSELHNGMHTWQNLPHLDT